MTRPKTQPTERMCPVCDRARPEDHFGPWDDPDYRADMVCPACGNDRHISTLFELDVLGLAQWVTAADALPDVFNQEENLCLACLVRRVVLRKQAIEKELKRGVDDGDAPPTGP